jgi:AcrR family transcriptional regulator
MNESTGLRERKKAETRTAIRQAVLHLALERGLEAVTADDIAAAANVSVRTFHNYFGSKEEALVAAWRSEFQIHVDALRDRPADESILVSLEQVFSGIASSVVARPTDVETHVDLLWTSLAMARYRSVLLDEAIPAWSPRSSQPGRAPTRRPTSTPPRDGGGHLGHRHRVPVPAARRYRPGRPRTPGRGVLRAAARRLRPSEGGERLIDGCPGG